MQSIYVFLDIAKFTNFWWKNADVIRTKKVCHVVHISFKTASLLEHPACSIFKIYSVLILVL